MAACCMRAACTRSSSSWEPCPAPHLQVLCCLIHWREVEEEAARRSVQRAIRKRHHATEWRVGRQGASERGRVRGGGVSSQLLCTMLFSPTLAAESGRTAPRAAAAAHLAGLPSLARVARDPQVFMCTIQRARDACWVTSGLGQMSRWLCAAHATQQPASTTAATNAFMNAMRLLHAAALAGQLLLLLRSPLLLSACPCAGTYFGPVRGDFRQRSVAAAGILCSSSRRRMDMRVLRTRKMDMRVKRKNEK